jgi:branched-chain amino acid transport system permease protein
MNYLLHLLVLLDIYFILSLSLNIIMGYTGLLTLAHAGYFALGSYAYAIASMFLGWGFLPSALVAVVINVLFSGMLSVASWRFRGDFFILFSLTIQVVLFTILKNWFDPTQPPGSWRNLTNGDFGLAGIPSPSIAGYELDSRSSVAIAFTLLAIGAAGFSWALLRSPWGRLLRALRDDELAARSLGKDVRVAKMQAIAIGCGMAGFAGVMLASYQAYINPTSADMSQATLLFSMVIVGGLGNSVLGPFVGALLLIAIPEGLRFIDLPIALAAELRLMAYGFLLVLLMHVRPQGVAGSYRME